MASKDEELVVEGMACWVGLERTGWRTAKALLKYCLISGWQFGRREVQYLAINESGRRYLRGERLIYPVTDNYGGTKMAESIEIAAWW